MHCGLSPVLIRPLVIIWLVAKTSADAPGPQETTGDGELDEIKYLSKFGYLDKLQANQYQHADVISKSIREFQKFNGLPVTGQLDMMTRDKMKQPRCGMPDMKQPKRQVSPKGYEISGEKWSKRDLTYTFVSYTAKLEEDQQETAVANAFKKWSDVTQLTFRAKEGKVDIEIGFNVWDHGDGPKNAFDGNGGTLAHAFSPGDQDISGDVHFDDDEDWTIGTDEGTNFEIVAAHEFGHALGLEHSSNPKALMAPYYQGYDPNYSLHEDDIRGIDSLYGSWPDPSDPDQPPDQPPNQPPDQPPTQSADQPPPQSPTHPPPHSPAQPPAKPPARRPKPPGGKRVVKPLPRRPKTTCPKTPCPNRGSTNRDQGRIFKFRYRLKKPEYKKHHSKLEIRKHHSKPDIRKHHSSPGRQKHHSNPGRQKHHSNPGRQKHHSKPYRGRGKRSPDVTKKRLASTAGRGGDHCSLTFDAIEKVHDGSILAFQGAHVYKITERGPVQMARLIGEVLQGAPQSPDAVVYDGERRKLFIFKAKTYWRYTGYRLDAGYPRSLPTAFRGMSAAVERDSAIFLFQGKKFTQWTEISSSQPQGFPRNSADNWTNLPADVNAAFRSSGGDYYFFKGQRFWRYNSQGLLLPGFPADIKTYWLNC